MLRALVSPVLRFASGLRSPWLFAVTALLFLLDLVVPDFVPFVDEILLGLLTLLLARRRKVGHQSAGSPGTRSRE